MTREECINKLTYNGKIIIDNNLKTMLYGLFDHFEHRITEIEAPKTCDSCKYVHETKDDPNFQGLSCTKTEMWDMEENFYCSYYELKDDK